MDRFWHRLWDGPQWADHVHTSVVIGIFIVAVLIMTIIFAVHDHRTSGELSPWDHLAAYAAKLLSPRSPSEYTADEYFANRGRRTKRKSNPTIYDKIDRGNDRRRQWADRMRAIARKQSKAGDYDAAARILERALLVYQQIYDQQRAAATRNELERARSRSKAN